VHSTIRPTKSALGERIQLGMPLLSMPTSRLDHWMPSPAVRIHHRRTAAADEHALWDAARAVRLRETRTLGRLVRWRIPGLDPDLTYHELFSGYPFTVLEEDDGLLISGLVGRIWTLARDYPRLDGPEAFAAWSQPGTVRVLFAHWVTADGGGAELVSEARVAPVDRVAALRLRALWSVVGPFQRLVGAEPLALAARRASGR
jgi:hypothetical protein